MMALPGWLAGILSQPSAGVNQVSPWNAGNAGGAQANYNFSAEPDILPGNVGRGPSTPWNPYGQPYDPYPIVQTNQPGQPQVDINPPGYGPTSQPSGAGYGPQGPFYGWMAGPGGPALNFPTTSRFDPQLGWIPHAQAANDPFGIQFDVTSGQWVVNTGGPAGGMGSSLVGTSPAHGGIRWNEDSPLDRQLLALTGGGGGIGGIGAPRGYMII